MAQETETNPCETDGGTLMDFTHEGLKSEQSLTGHKHGWTSTFERLEAFLVAGGAS